MEIFGLVIIVILLALGLLFAVLILSKGPSQQTQRVKESIQAANFLNTIMGTTSIGCGGRTVRELIQNCAVSSETWAGAATCDDGITNTCQMTQDMMNTMLNRTLGTWGKTYQLNMTGTKAVERISVVSGPCRGEREGSTRPEKIRSGLDVQISLYICR